MLLHFILSSSISFWGTCSDNRLSGPKGKHLIKLLATKYAVTYKFHRKEDVVRNDTLEHVMTKITAVADAAAEEDRKKAFLLLFAGLGRPTDSRRQRIVVASNPTTAPTAMPTTPFVPLSGPVPPLLRPGEGYNRRQSIMLAPAAPVPLPIPARIEGAVKPADGRKGSVTIIASKR